MSSGGLFLVHTSNKRFAFLVTMPVCVRVFVYVCMCVHIHTSTSACFMCDHNWSGALVRGTRDQTEMDRFLLTHTTTPSTHTHSPATALTWIWIVSYMRYYEWGLLNGKQRHARARSVRKSVGGLPFMHQLRTAVHGFASSRVVFFGRRHRCASRPFVCWRTRSLGSKMYYLIRLLIKMYDVWTSELLLTRNARWVQQVVACTALYAMEFQQRCVGLGSSGHHRQPGVRLAFRKWAEWRGEQGVDVSFAIGACLMNQ